MQDTCLHSVQFIAHLTNQQVAHEILGLQILTLLLETPTDDSVEVKFVEQAELSVSSHLILNCCLTLVLLYILKSFMIKFL